MCVYGVTARRSGVPTGGRNMPGGFIQKENKETGCIYTLGPLEEQA